MNKKTLILIVLIAVLGVGFLFYQEAKAPTSDGPVSNVPLPIASYEDCVTAGGAIQESNPPRCVTKDGKTFTEDIGNVPDKSSLIIVSDLAPNQKVKSPLTIHGKARGTWFFEASFPIRVADGNGKNIGSAVAQAKGEWMTEDFVPFTATITFTKPTTKDGTISLLKDNPSGLPENDDALVIPVQF